MFKVRLITSGEEGFDDVQRIRKTVFVDEQGVDKEDEYDRFDIYGAPALFAVLYDGDDYAGTARLIINEEGYKIGRVAVLKKYRGKGYGDVLVRTLVAKAFSMGAKEVLVHSQLQVIPFYEKIGFVVCGEELIDSGILHKPMKISELHKCGGNHG